MHPKFDDFLENIVNLEDEQKEEIGRTALKDIYKRLHEREDCSREECAQWVIDITKLFVSADKKTAIKEYEFFKNVTGIDLTSDEFYNATNHGSDEEFVRKMIIRFKDLYKETRQAILVYAAALTSSDDSIIGGEIDLFEQLTEDDDFEDDD